MPGMGPPHRPCATPRCHQPRLPVVGRRSKPLSLGLGKRSAAGGSPSPYRLGSHRECAGLRVSVCPARGLLSRLSEWIVSYSDSQVRIIIFHFPPSPAVCTVAILSACTGHTQRWPTTARGRRGLESGCPPEAGWSRPPRSSTQRAAYSDIHAPATPQSRRARSVMSRVPQSWRWPARSRARAS